MEKGIAIVMCVIGSVAKGHQRQKQKREQKERHEAERQHGWFFLCVSIPTHGDWQRKWSETRGMLSHWFY